MAKEWGLGEYCPKADNALFKNFYESTIKIKLNEAEPICKFEHCFSIDLEQYNCKICVYDRKIINMWFWTRSFDRMLYYSTSKIKILNCFKDLKSIFSKSDMEILEWGIIYELGTQKGADAENTAKFIKAYRTEKRYTYRLGYFPLINISLNPSQLSKIVVQHGDYFISRGYMDKERLSLQKFNNEHVLPPVKLLAYYLMKEPFNKKIIEDSIGYFRECPHEEKKGAFSILYKILNPFEVT